MPSLRSSFALAALFISRSTSGVAVEGVAPVVLGRAKPARPMTKFVDLVGMLKSPLGIASDMNMGSLATLRIPRNHRCPKRALKSTISL